MLVLSRKKGESIVIDHNITVVVVDIRGDKVRLGIQAPDEVSVHREEVYEAIKRENQRKKDDDAKKAAKVHQETQAKASGEDPHLPSQ